MQPQELANQKLADINAAIAKKQEELRQLGFRYDRLNKEIIRLQQHHDNFIQYESRAKKALADKDAELLKREALLSGTDMSLVAQRSNLPQM